MKQNNRLYFFKTIPIFPRVSKHLGAESNTTHCFTKSSEAWKLLRLGYSVCPFLSFQIFTLLSVAP